MDSNRATPRESDRGRAAHSGSDSQNQSRSNETSGQRLERETRLLRTVSGDSDNTSENMSMKQKAETSKSDEEEKKRAEWSASKLQANQMDRMIRRTMTSKDES